MDFVFDPSLVLYLPLYQLEGASFMSKDAHGHLCSVTGALWRPNGREFDGDDFISIPAVSSITSPTQGTIVVWFKGDPAARAIFSASDKDGVGVHEFYIHRTGDKLAYRTEEGGTRQDLITTNDTYTAGAWHFVAFISDGSTIMANVNGNAEALTINAGVNNGTFIGGLTLIDSVAVGSLRRPTPVYYTGDVGAVWLYSRPLAQVELGRLYDVTKWRYQ